MPDVGTTVYKSLLPAKVTGMVQSLSKLISADEKSALKNHQRNSYSSHFPVIEWN